MSCIPSQVYRSQQFNRSQLLSASLSYQGNICIQSLTHHHSRRDNRVRFLTKHYTSLPLVSNFVVFKRLRSLREQHGLSMFGGTPCQVSRAMDLLGGCDVTFDSSRTIQERAKLAGASRQRLITDPPLLLSSNREAKVVEKFTRGIIHCQRCGMEALRITTDSRGGEQDNARARFRAPRSQRSNTPVAGDVREKVQAFIRD